MEKFHPAPVIRPSVIRSIVGLKKRDRRSDTWACANVAKILNRSMISCEKEIRRVKGFREISNISNIEAEQATGQKKEAAAYPSQPGATTRSTRNLTIPLSWPNPIFFL
jgi:hypothetical protein